MSVIRNLVLSTLIVYTYSTCITCSSQCIGLQAELTGEAEFIRTWYSVGHNYVNMFISSVASKNNT